MYFYYLFLLRFRNNQDSSHLSGIKGIQDTIVYFPDKYFHLMYRIQKMHKMYIPKVKFPPPKLTLFEIPIHTIRHYTCTSENKMPWENVKYKLNNYSDWLKSKLKWNRIMMIVKLPTNSKYFDMFFLVLPTIVNRPHRQGLIYIEINYLIYCNPLQRHTGWKGLMFVLHLSLVLYYK